MKNTYIITTAEKNIKSLISEEQSKLIATNILHFILGIFVSKGIAFGVYAPFGTAFLSAVPYKNMLFSLVDTKIEDLEVNNLLIEKFGKCKREN